MPRKVGRPTAYVKVPNYVLDEKAVTLYLPGMSKKPIRFELRLTDEGWSRIDEWRRRQPDLPNRTEAVRRLIEIALKAEQKPGEAPST
jgi:hypothetical protein